MFKLVFCLYVFQLENLKFAIFTPIFIKKMQNHKVLIFKLVNKCLVLDANFLPIPGEDVEKKECEH